MLHRLKTQEALRLAAAKWLLVNDRHNICCFGNELGEEFIKNYELPWAEEELLETIVDANDNITLVFQSKIKLNARETVSGKPAVFIFLRYVRAMYDDSGNIYGYATLGYTY